MSTREDVEYYGPDCLKWSLEDRKNNDVFYEEFQKTSVGQEIIKAGLKSTDNLYEIIGSAQEHTGRVEITLREAEAAAKELFLAGDLQSKKTAVEQPPAPKRLSASQLQWREWREYTDSHSVAECRAKARVDEGYRKFLSLNLEREMNDISVPDAVVAIGTAAVRQDKTVRITQELNDFAIAYRTMSSAEVRKNSNLLTNPNAASWNRNVDLAIKAGLL